MRLPSFLGLPSLPIPNEDVFQNNIFYGTKLPVAAMRKNWPFLVSLSVFDSDRSDFHFCGGSLIAPGWVLTAAHCWMLHNDVGLQAPGTDTADNDPRACQVRIGAKGLNGRELDEEVIPAKRVYIHRDWVDLKRIDTGDIALVELAWEVKNPPLIKLEFQTPSCCDKSSRLFQSKAQVAGWGYTDITKSYIPAAASQAELLIRSDAYCTTLSIPSNNRGQPPIAFFKSTSKGYTLDFDDLICAGGLPGILDPSNKQQQDSCSGDSGGPVVITKANGDLAQIALVSFGPSADYCGRMCGAYTDLSVFKEFIQQLVPSAVDNSLKNPAAVTHYVFPKIGLECSCRKWDFPSTQHVFFY